jgi:hypothetical protein
LKKRIRIKGLIASQMRETKDLLKIREEEEQRRFSLIRQLPYPRITKEVWPSLGPQRTTISSVSSSMVFDQ